MSAPMNYVLVDFENVQPKDLELLKKGPFKVKVFVGPPTSTCLTPRVHPSRQPQEHNATCPTRSQRYVIGSPNTSPDSS